MGLIRPGQQSLQEDRYLFNNMKRFDIKKRGFTLIEMIVSLGLFTIILFALSSAFLTVINADRKSRATSIALDNLNLALEDMSRRIKTGYAYDCGPLGAPKDCMAGDSTLNFTDQNGNRTTYRPTTDTFGIDRATIGLPVLRITAPEIKITNLKFIVNGTATTPGDTVSPYVTILISGTTNVGLTSSTFNMETTVTQRKYDF